MLFPFSIDCFHWQVSLRSFDTLLRIKKWLWNSQDLNEPSFGIFFKPKAHKRNWTNNYRCLWPIMNWRLNIHYRQVYKRLQCQIFFSGVWFSLQFLYFTCWCPGGNHSICKCKLSSKLVSMPAQNLHSWTEGHPLLFDKFPEEEAF